MSGKAYNVNETCFRKSFVKNSHKYLVNTFQKVLNNTSIWLLLATCWNWNETLHFTPPNTSRNENIVITSKQRHFDVIMSQWRRFDIITTSLLCDVSVGPLWHWCLHLTHEMFRIWLNFSKLYPLHHNDIKCHTVSKHQQHDCLLNSLFRLATKASAKHFVRIIHRWPVESTKIGPVMQIAFPWYDVIMDYWKSEQIGIMTSTGITANL